MKSHFFYVAFILSFLSSSAFSLNRRGAPKVQTFYGKVQLVQNTHTGQNEFILEDSKGKVYLLLVPEHIQGVSLLSRGKRVEVKGIFMKGPTCHPSSRDTIKVKNLVPKKAKLKS